MATQWLPTILEGRVASMKDQPFHITADVLDFIQNNVLSVSEVTRTTKLTEILDAYADRKSEEVFIIHNTRKKNSRGVFMDLEYFAELIRIKQLVEESADLIVERTAFDRIEQTASAGLDQAAKHLDLTEEDIADIMEIAEIEP